MPIGPYPALPADPPRFGGRKGPVDFLTERGNFLSMSTTAERLQSELANLSEADRGELAHFLIQSLHSGADADAERAWDVELERRGQQIRSGHATGEPAE